jgi:hypothetical protein
MKYLITENQFDTILKGLETSINDIVVDGVKKVMLKYNESSDMIEVHLYFDKEYAKELGIKFGDKIRGAVRRLFPILKNIKLGPKYEFYSHYYE